MATASSASTESFILRELAAGAPADELHARFREARARAVDDEEAARLDAAIGHAMDVQRVLQEERRRAQALAGLSDAAATIASVEELDAVLKAVCRQARLLLGADAALVSLGDAAAEDLGVAATDGIVSNDLRTVRVTPGTGLVGTVVARGTGEVTTDYAVDHRFAHREDLDRLVAREGLRAMAAVPLHDGRRIVGVVLCAWRAARRLEPGDLAVLERLAVHAAIAIERARVLDEARRDRDAVRRRATLHRSLSEALLDGAGLSAVLEAIAGALDGHLELRGADGDRVAVTACDPTLREATDIVEVPVAAGSERLGSLRLLRLRADGTEESLLAEAAETVGALMRQAGGRRFAGDVVHELFAGDRSDPRLLARRAARFGLDLDAPHVLLVARVAASAARWGAVVARCAAMDDGGVGGLVDDRIVVVVPGDDADAAARRWATKLAGRDGEPPTLVVEGPVRSVEALVAGYDRAERALGILLAMGREGQTASVEDLAPFGLLFGNVAPGDLRGFLEGTLGPVAMHDATRNTELMTTLEAFFANAGNLANTARMLGVHVNTLYQRLERLDEVLGADWRTPDRRLELHLALRLRTLDERLGAHPAP